MQEKNHCKKKILNFLWKVFGWAETQSNQWIACGIYTYFLVSESQQVGKNENLGSLFRTPLLRS